MSDQEDFDFSEMIRSAMPEQIISNFIAVCEVLTENGIELRVATSDSITPWLAMGMLQSTMDTLQSAEDIYGFGDEEEFEDDQ